MPPPVLNDSDDEDEDLLLDDANERSVARSSEHGTIPNLDGSRDTNAQSAGSTDRLKKQLEDAHRNLFIDSGEQAQSNSGDPSAQAPSTSPLLSRNKRRHTESTSNPTASADNITKRTKTQQHSSARKSSSVLTEKQRSFAEFTNEGADPKPSPSAGFSEHPYSGTFSGLPSIQADFADHEPAVMFKESSSTVPDNDSSHDRMVAQALQSRTNGRTSMVKLNDSDELQAKSSSFPWSASAQTEATMTPTGKSAAEGTMDQDEPSAIDHDQPRHMEPEHQHEEEDIQVSALPSSKKSEPAHGSFVQSQEMARSHASPTVQVNVNEANAVTSASASEPHEAPQATQESSRGSKRKTQEELSDPLNSEDNAVGLLREYYKPRPSKRRSTQVAQEPVDYSVAPERAARSKRSKTAGEALSAAKWTSEDTASQGTPSAKQNTRSSKSRKVEPAPAQGQTDDEIKCICGSREDDGNTVACDTCDRWQHIRCYYPESRGKLPRNMRHDCIECRPESAVDHQKTLEDKPPNGSPIDPAATSATNSASADHSLEKTASPKLSTEQKEARSQQADLDHGFKKPGAPASQTSSQPKNDDSVFKKSASKLKPISKSKRSHTTIFEDHMEFTGSQRSPNLRQQQAARKSALKDVENEAFPGKRRKSAKLPDDDDEDELALDNKNEEDDEDMDEQAEEPPKKRGRGRPPKAAPKAAENPSANLKEKVVEGFDDNDDEDDEIPVEQPKKRGRGRSRKASAPEAKEEPAAQSTEVPDDTASGAPKEQPTTAQPTKEKSTELPAEPEPPSRQSAASNMLTPSPDKPVPSKAAAAPQTPRKKSPTFHSPISKSSTVSHRVGLNKRQRVAPLLKIRRDPPPKRT